MKLQTVLLKLMVFAAAAVVLVLTIFTQSCSQGGQASQSIAAVANITINILIVYKYGIHGVALVYVLTEIMLFTGYAWYVWRTR